MFGFFKWKRTVQHTVSFISGLMAPLGERLPNQIFGDAFVIGFLQRVSIHCSLESSGQNISPAHLATIFEQVLKSFVLDFATQIVAMLPKLNDPASSHNAAYAAGCRDGEILMKSHIGLASAEDGKAALEGFHDFIRRNYLSANRRQA